MAINSISVMRLNGPQGIGLPGITRPLRKRIKCAVLAYEDQQDKPDYQNENQDKHGYKDFLEHWFRVLILKTNVVLELVNFFHLKNGVQDS